MSAPTWNVIAPGGVRSLEYHSAMGATGGRCECIVTGGGKCKAKATCVVAYRNPLEPERLAACCDACRRRCFGSTAKERGAVRKDAEQRQVLAFDAEVVNREDPQAWRR